MTRLQTCCICGEKDVFSYSFPQVLKELGYEGVYAHPSCVSNEQKIREDYRQRYGTDLRG